MSKENKTIQLICKACGAEMTVDEDERIVSCQYCGSKELIRESDAVKIERIKTKAYKEVEMERMRHEQEMHEKQAEEMAVTKFKKSILSKVLILLILVSVVGVFSDFKALHILSGLIGILQTAAFGGAWLCGMHMIKPPVKNMHLLLTIIGVLLFVPGSMAASESNGSQTSRPAQNEPIVTVEETKTESEKETVAETESETKKETKAETKEETQAPETEKQENVAGIDPDFKETMDSYEAFMNDYVEFMKKYEESDDVFAMLAEYTEIMTDYADFMEKMDAIDEDELNDAELAYYIEVTGRVSQKLLELN